MNTEAKQQKRSRCNFIKFSLSTPSKSTMSRPTIYVSGGHQTLQMDETAEEKSAAVAEKFVTMMDSLGLGWYPRELHEDAVMDWFGVCLRGRSSIMHFLKTRFLKMHHVIERVSKIPPVSHRLLKRSRTTKKPAETSNVPLTEECGQGDCKGLSDPDNPIVPNLKEMVKAPRVKRPTSCSIDREECEFLEIQGKLEFEYGELFLEKKLERIILGYTDHIHLIIYETKNNCQKKLFG